MSHRALRTSVLAALCLWASSCQSANHALRVGSNVATVNVLMTGLQSQDQGRNDWIYELSACSNGVPTLNGTLAAAAVPGASNTTQPVITPYDLDTPASASNTVTFSDAGLAAGLTGCQFRVKTLQPAAGIYFSGEPNVLYWSRELSITENPDGTLVATAALQQLYSSTPDAATAFTLQMPVKFPAAESGAPITGLLTCKPALPNVGTYASKAGSTTEGTLTFTATIPATTPFSCSDLYVGVGGVAQKYHAALGGNAASFSGVQTTTTTTNEVSLVLVNPGTPTATATGTGTGTGADSNVVVTTSAASGVGCPANQHYNTADHACDNN